jgi:hypothetical protein|nr:hypothetical protein [Brevibacillus massiliensis]
MVQFIEKLVQFGAQLDQFWSDGGVVLVLFVKLLTQLLDLSEDKFNAHCSHSFGYFILMPHNYYQYMLNLVQYTQL